MTGEERRGRLVAILSKSSDALSGEKLASELQVTRQVIVQDIALLRANGNEIISTNRGYILKRETETQRVLKLYHTDEQTEEELNTIIDLGGKVKNVSVFHRVYGLISANLSIRSRKDVRQFIEGIRTGKSSLLKNVTSNYHYHTVTADSEETLDMIQNELEKRGFLAKLQDHEPEELMKNRKNTK